MILKTFSSEKRYVESSLKFIKKICRSKTRGLIRIGIDGGRSTRPVFKALPKTKLPFNRIELFEIDERYVPSNHPHSNFKLLQQYLIAPLKDKINNFFYFETNLTISQSLKKYQKILSKIKNHIDLTILGAGEDGHIASLFPYAECLTETKKLVTHTQTTIFDCNDRLTITLPIFMASHNSLLLLKGKEKKPILTELLHGKKEIIEFPAKALLKNKNLVVYYCEQ